MTPPPRSLPICRIVRKAMYQILWILGIIAVWFALQAWILPKLGVST